MRICPVCEGLTSSEQDRCGTCNVPLVRTTEVAWIQRDGDEFGRSPWVGVVLGGKYRVTGVLGKGGMGTVFRAVHELSLLSVAVKVLHPSFARHASFKSTLIAEARKASLLRDEHTARVLDVGETPEGSIFIAMELALGETLDRVLERERRLPHWVVSELLLQILAGLEEAADRGLVHRDLSPRNIMIEAREDGFRAKILDFGIATLRDDTSKEHAGRWVHPPYTAPEILKGEAHDARADLFSLGVIAVECLMGTPPFTERRANALDDRIRAVIEDRARLPGVKDAPRKLTSLLARLLAKEPENRPASPRAVIEVVEDIRRPTSVGFQAAAVLSMILGSTALLTSLATRSTSEPFLQANSASSIVLEPRRSPGVQPQFLPIERIERVSFLARGLGPRDVVVRGYDGTESIFEYELGGTLTGGRLELDASKDSSWRAVLDSCSRHGRPVSIDFQERKTQRLVAHALVFVDTRAPAFDVTDPPSRLMLTSRLRFRVDEDSPLLSLRFELRREDVVLATHDAGVVEGQRDFDLPIAKLFVDRAKEGVSLDEFSPAILACTAIDAAGRRTTWEHELARVDLSIPEIVGLHGSGSPIDSDGGQPATIAVDAGVARIVVDLSGEERSPSRLYVRTRRELDRTGESERVLDASKFNVSGARLTFLQDAIDPDAGSLEFTIVLEDASGNQSRPKTRSLVPEGVQLDAAFAIVTEDGERDLVDRVARLARTPWSVRVSAGHSLTLTYRCRSQWLPMPQTDIDPEISVHGREPGRCTISIPALETGQRLGLLVHHVRADASTVEPLRTTTSLSIEVLPPLPRVEVPESLTSGRAFSSELVDAKLLTTLDDRMRIAARLVPSPIAALGLRVRYWHERDGRWFAGDWAVVTSAEEFARESAPMFPGRNRIALEVQDVIGRSAPDAGPTIDVGTARAVLVADFWHAATSDSASPATTSAVSVEFGRPVPVVVADAAPLPQDAQTTLLHGQRSFAGRISITQDQRREHRFDLPFDFVSAVCGWTSIARESFAVQGAATEEFILRTRAGERRCRVRFEPTRSLLRGVRLASLGVNDPELRDLHLSPCLAPTSGLAIELGPPSGVAVRGSVSLDPPVIVRGLKDVFVGSHEITRRAWLAFMRDALQRRGRLGFDEKAIAHIEDPLSDHRLTDAGLRPDTSRFGNVSFEECAKRGPDRPVTGIDYYQASAFCRWLGLATFGDPDFFRLPFGAELEWAALGDRIERGDLQSIRSATTTTAAAWARGFDAYRERARLTGAREDVMDPARWPRDVDENRMFGDVVRAWDGSEIVGLEFGVREWIEDVPTIGSGPSYRLLVEIHERHVEYAARRRFDRTLKPPRILAMESGQLRGMTWGEPRLHGHDPMTDLQDVRGKGSAAGILGVKRICFVRRDGVGLDEKVAPLMTVAGFRIVGGEAFVRFVRSRS
ncbi:MAG: protein kinase [Planctomycetes bacterium]|nr:protein kinase [Planctomycetota bacterium]